MGLGAGKYRQALYCRSPLTQGGLEVTCSVTAFWENEEWLGILKQHLEEKYSVTIQDDSNSILKELIASDSGDTVASIAGRGKI